MATPTPAGFHQIYEPVSPARAWFAVSVFFLAQIVSTIDRGMLALVIDPVRHDLGITEIQIALLQGFAFAIFYVTVGLPLGVVADMVNRRALLIGGIIVWSLATMGGGLARGFGDMFASRLFIGVGEAVLGPCAVTMIADMFAPNRRGRPMALYVLGSMVAYGLGSLVCGYILQIAPQGAFDFIAPLRGVTAWRIAFIVVGALGLLVACLMVFLHEPKRQSVKTMASEQTALKATLTHFRTHYRVLVPMYGTVAMFAMGGAMASGWGAALLSRSFGFAPATAGQHLGVAQIAWALVGAGLASVLVDYVARRAGVAGKLKLAGILALVGIPSCTAILATGGDVAAIMVSEIMFVSAVFGTTMLSVFADVMPARSRGTSVALYAFVMTMIGGSLGPLIVAYLTQHVFGDPSSLGLSMALAGSVAMACSAILAFVTARALSRATPGFANLQAVPSTDA